MESWADIASRGWVSTNFVPDYAIICGRAVVCCRRRSLCSLFCDCTCAVPAPATSLHSSLRWIVLWVCRVFSGLCRSSRWWSGFRRFRLRARALSLSGTGVLRVFAVVAEPRRPANPPMSLLSAGRFVDSTRINVYKKNLVLVRFLYRFVSMMRTTGKPRLALPPGTRAMDLRPKKCALKHNKRRKCPRLSATFRRNPRQATSASRETTHEIRRDI